MLPRPSWVDDPTASLDLAFEVGEYFGLKAAEARKIARVIEGLFGWYCEHPEDLPDGDGELSDRVVDFIAGMTDRYAIREYTRRFVPSGLAV